MPSFAYFTKHKDRFGLNSWPKFFTTTKCSGTFYPISQDYVDLLVA